MKPLRANHFNFHIRAHTGRLLTVRLLAVRLLTVRFLTARTGGPGAPLATGGGPRSQFGVAKGARIAPLRLKAGQRRRTKAKGAARCSWLMSTGRRVSGKSGTVRWVEQFAGFRVGMRAELRAGRAGTEFGRLARGRGRGGRFGRRLSVASVWARLVWGGRWARLGARGAKERQVCLSFWWRQSSLWRGGVAALAPLERRRTATWAHAHKETR